MQSQVFNYFWGDGAKPLRKILEDIGTLIFYTKNVIFDEKEPKFHFEQLFFGAKGEGSKKYIFWGGRSSKNFDIYLFRLKLWAAPYGFWNNFRIC